MITLDAKGAILSRKDATAADFVTPPKPVIAPVTIAQEKLTPRRVVKQVAKGDLLTAVAYWGGTLQTFTAGGQEKTCQLLPQDITGLTWAGATLVVGLADGRILGLTVQ